MSDRSLSHLKERKRKKLTVSLSKDSPFQSPVRFPPLEGKAEKANSVSFSLLPLCPALHPSVSVSVSLCVALCTYQCSRLAALGGPLWLFVRKTRQGSAGSWGVSQMVFFAWSKENLSYNCHQKASWLYLLIPCQKITIGWPRGRFGGVVFHWAGGKCPFTVMFWLLKAICPCRH